MSLDCPGAEVDSGSSEVKICINVHPTAVNKPLAT